MPAPVLAAQRAAHDDIVRGLANLAVEQTAGSHSLAAAAHRDRWFNPRAEAEVSLS
jgi:hypothetical protein